MKNFTAALMALIAGLASVSQARAQSAAATTNPPLYTPGGQALSQTLSGGLRVQPMAGATAVSAANPLATSSTISGAAVSAANPLPVTTSDNQTQGSTTAGQSGPLVQGAVTTAAPTYVTGQTAPLSLFTTGALRVQLSSATGTALSQSFSFGSGTGLLVGALYNTTPFTMTNAATTSLQADVRGNLKTSTGGTQSQLNITGATTAKATLGKLYRVILNTAGSTATSIIDSTGTTVTAANTILTIPATATAGTVFVMEWPFATGLSIVPGTGAVLAVSYD